MLGTTYNPVKVGRWRKSAMIICTGNVANRLPIDLLAASKSIALMNVIRCDYMSILYSLNTNGCFVGNHLGIGSKNRNFVLMSVILEINFGGKMTPQKL